MRYPRTHRLVAPMPKCAGRYVDSGARKAHDRGGADQRVTDGLRTGGVGGPLVECSAIHLATEGSSVSPRRWRVWA